ncbi:MAG: hypothetical protein KAI07_01965 [Deltaproteobacteria bacterium]|nr:hypothetical protein [Deltaproteobacteria bacterium]
MKSKTTYALLLGTLGLLTLFFFTMGSNEDIRTLSVSKAPIGKVLDNKMLSLKDKDKAISEDKLAKIIDSIKQLQKNIENQDKKFQNELALLKGSQLETGQIEENNQIEEEEENITTFEKEQQSHAWYQKQADSIETVLTDEKPDEKWTEETQQTLEAALEVSDNNINVQNITCGESICKLNAELKGGDMSSGPNIDHLVYGDMEWDGPILSKYDADTGEITVFLMRPGVDMSDFEPEV